MNSTSPLGRCSPGYYCPTQSTTPTEIPCPPRFYRPELGAGSVSDCSLCVAGGYCPEASVYPTICPKGYFCIGGVSIPEPCLPGSYGNTTGLRYLQSFINLFSRVNITSGLSIKQIMILPTAINVMLYYLKCDICVSICDMMWFDMTHSDVDYTVLWHISLIIIFISS